MDVDSSVDKFVVDGAFFEVGARDFVASGFGHQSQRAHTGARDARNVDIHDIII